MKAMVIHRYGDADVFGLEDIAPPEPGPDQVLLEVHGSSVNPLDAGIRGGMLRLFVRLKLPAVLGVDVSGEVVGVGADVRRFEVGDRVYGYTGVGAGGGYGELAVVAEESREGLRRREVRMGIQQEENIMRFGIIGAGHIGGKLYNQQLTLEQARSMVDLD